MPLLVLCPRAKAKPLTALEIALLDALENHIAVAGHQMRAADFDPAAGTPSRADARRALSALWRRGLLTRVGWGDTAVYRRRP